MSYGRALGLHASREPGRAAVVHEGRTTSFAELERRSNRLARAYAKLAVAKGDFVTIALPNSVEFLESAFAVWKLGAVPQPISSRLPELERAAIVAQADPVLVVGVAAGSYAERACLPAGYEADLALADDALPDAVSPHSQAIASGGSTGLPKLIVDALPAECDPEADFYGIGTGATVLVPGPLYHTGPFINARQTLLSGGTVILMSRFDATQSLELIERHRVQ